MPVVTEETFSKHTIKIEYSTHAAMPWGARLDTRSGALRRWKFVEPSWDSDAPYVLAPDHVANELRRRHDADELLVLSGFKFREGEEPTATRTKLVGVIP